MQLRQDAENKFSCSAAGVTPTGKIAALYCSCSAFTPMHECATAASGDRPGYKGTRTHVACMSWWWGPKLLAPNLARDEWSSPSSDMASAKGSLR